MHVIIFDAYVVHDRYEYDTQNTLKCSYTHKPGAGVSSINMHGPRPCYLAPGAMHARTLVSPYRQRRRLFFFFFRKGRRRLPLVLQELLLQEGAAAQQS